MVLRKESVRTQLRKLEETLARLREKADISLSEYRANLDLQWLIERGLEVSASLILDIGNHILAGAFQVSVDEHEEVLEKLHEKKVISDELYEDLRGLGGFRNILVHGYLDLDIDLVYAHYQKALRVFPRFVAEIERWLETYKDETQDIAD